MTALGDNVHYSFTSHRKAMRELRDTMKELAGSTELTEQQMQVFADLFNPRRELLERLNIRLKGGDPGQPLNWRGEAGLYR